MDRAFIGAALTTASLTFAAPLAQAHVTLETRSHRRLDLQGGPPCWPWLRGLADSQIRVQIPEGVIGVKPMPKAGWMLETVKSEYAGSYTMWDEQVTSGVEEIVWTGRLLDEHYDEFVFRGYLADQLSADTMLYFPVVQEWGW